jgi:hypothetical protein
MAVDCVGGRQRDFCSGRQYVPQPNTERNSMGIPRSILCTRGCRSFLPFKERSFRRPGAALYCGQRLSIAGLAVGNALFSDRCFLSRFNPNWSLCRPSNRASLFQPYNALYDRLRRYRAAWRGSSHTGSTRRGYRSSLHSDYSGAVGKQVQERALGLVPRCLRHSGSRHIQDQGRRRPRLPGAASDTTSKQRLEHRKRTCAY